MKKIITLLLILSPLSASAHHEGFSLTLVNTLIVFGIFFLVFAGLAFYKD